MEEHFDRWQKHERTERKVHPQWLSRDTIQCPNLIFWKSLICRNFLNGIIWWNKRLDFWANYSPSGPSVTLPSLTRCSSMKVRRCLMAVSTHSATPGSDKLPRLKKPWTHGSSYSSNNVWKTVLNFSVFIKTTVCLFVPSHGQTWSRTYQTMSWKTKVS